MDRKDEIKAAATKLALQSLVALEAGDVKTASANVSTLQDLLREYCTLIPDGEQKEALLKSIAAGDKILANGEDA